MMVDRHRHQTSKNQAGCEQLQRDAPEMSANLLDHLVDTATSGTLEADGLGVLDVDQQPIAWTAPALSVVKSG
jgi:hypothetical protein